MQTKWCHKCQVIRNMNETICENTSRDEDGKKRKHKFITYQCSVCNLVINSEEIINNPEITDNESNSDSEDRLITQNSCKVF